MAGGVSFFEIGVGDSEQGRAFYESLFGWRFEPPPREGWLIRTPNIAGGMHSGDAGAGPYLFFAVDDLDAAVARVVALGGEVVDTDPEPDPERGDFTEGPLGRFQLCRDDQGSMFGLHQSPQTG
jgi:predicted enzyme related to lactoylglutathione lyase